MFFSMFFCSDSGRSTIFFHFTWSDEKLFYNNVISRIESNWFSISFCSFQLIFSRNRSSNVTIIFSTCSFLCNLNAICKVKRMHWNEEGIYIISFNCIVSILYFMHRPASIHPNDDGENFSWDVRMFYIEFYDVFIVCSKQIVTVTDNQEFLNWAEQETKVLFNSNFIKEAESSRTKHISHC